MEPSNIVIHFRTLGGIAVPPETEGTYFSDVVHYPGPFESHTVHTITVGKNRCLYGHVLKEVEGKNVREYIHLREGTYRFTRPFQFLSLHMDYIESEIIQKLR
jgi:hypothetical protein